MAYNIEKYKELIGYGVRNTLYQARIHTLPAIFNGTPYADTKNGVPENFSVLCHSVTFPKVRGVNNQVINVHYEPFVLATERKEYDDITIKFRSSQNYMMRNLFEYWQNQIQKPKFTSQFEGKTDYSGVRAKPNDYKGIFIIDILNNEFKVIKRLQCNDCFPTSVSAIGDIGYDQNGEVEEVTITLASDWYEYFPGGDVAENGDSANNIFPIAPLAKK